MHQGVKVDIGMANRLPWPNFPFEKIWSAIKALRSSTYVKMIQLPSVSKANANVRILLIQAIQGIKVISIRALGNHPYQVETPCGVLQFDEFLTVIRVNLSLSPVYTYWPIRKSERSLH